MLLRPVPFLDRARPVSMRQNQLSRAGFATGRPVFPGDEGGGPRHVPPPSSALCLGRCCVLPRPACDWRHLPRGETGRARGLLVPIGLHAAGQSCTATSHRQPIPPVTTSPAAAAAGRPARGLQAERSGPACGGRSTILILLVASSSTYVVSAASPSCSCHLLDPAVQAPSITGATSPAGHPAALGRRSRPI